MLPASSASTTSAATGGVTLDGYGGLHAFGGLHLDTTGAAYWPSWDIARAVVVLPDGSGGWTLDGWGGTHPFGAARPLQGTPYWTNWDIARALVVNADRSSGYVVDGFGGVHPFGGAPALHGQPYWSGLDVARGFAVHLDSGGAADGGWTLDGWGGIHPFGAAPRTASGLQFWPWRDLYMKFHLTPAGHTYAVGRFGLFFDLSGGAVHPYWNGYSDWGGWDIQRDLVLLADDNGAPTAQPESSGAASAWWAHVWVWSYSVGAVQQGLPLDCEAAALEEATIERGRDVSQYTISDSLPNNDRGPATWAGNNIASWGDPYGEFVGSVYGNELRGTGYGVYDPPLVNVAEQHGFNAQGTEQGGADAVFTAFARGDPVLVITSNTFTPVQTRWWRAYDGRSVPYSLYEHAVTLVAENGVAGTVTVDDVADGRMKTFTMSQFASFYTSFLDMAVILH